jgi:hypothetical protein
LSIVGIAAMTFTLTTAGGPADARDELRSPGHAARRPVESRRPTCEVGQVPKWDGSGWRCADDLVGTGGPASAGPSLFDAAGAAVGPVTGSVASEGKTLPTLLLSLGDPKPFLLTVDEGGFQAGGRLFVPTTGEAFSCATQCLTDPACLRSCLSATEACQASNARLEATLASALFRTGGVIDPTPEKAELWTATSATAEPLAAECSEQLPLCVYVSYRPSDGTCGAEIVAQGNPKLVYPAQPLANLHALHPPPYSVRIE